MWLRWVWVFCVPLCAQADEPNFTGVWKLNPAASQISALPVPPASVVHIRHSRMSVHCTSDGVVVAQGCTCQTDGSEARVTANDITISSRAKWEDGALLISSIVTGSKNYTRMDRWTLTTDGNTLRVRCQIVGPDQDAESLLVYERHNAPAATAGDEIREPDGLRFGRTVLTPVEPRSDQYTTVDALRVPTSGNAAASVSCLAYEDATRIYVEVILRNRSSRPLDIAQDFIALEQQGHPIRRTSTVRASEEIHAGAIRPFKPKPTGRNPRTGESVYDRASVDEQVRQHLQWQEQESTFASLLTALAHTDAASVPSGEERAILSTFDPRPDIKAPVVVNIRLGSDVFRFVVATPSAAAPRLP